MKAREALHEISTMVFRNTDNFEMRISKDCYKAVVEALEKQTPTKVTHEATLYKCCTCPNCKNVLDRFEKWGERTVRITVAYCVFCGQAIDWNEESEDTE